MPARCFSTFSTNHPNRSNIKQPSSSFGFFSSQSPARFQTKFAALFQATSTPRSPLTPLFRRPIPDADGFITPLTHHNRQRSSDSQAALATKSAHADILISRNGRLPSTSNATPTTSPVPNHPNEPVPSSSSEPPDPSLTVATIIQLLSQLLEPTLSAAGLTDRLDPILAMLNPLLMLLLSSLHQNGSTKSP